MDKEYIEREALFKWFCDSVDIDGCVDMPENGGYCKPGKRYCDEGAAFDKLPAADVVPASAYNAAVETIRKLLCSEYGDSCQFCVWHNNTDAHCARIGGSGGWCCENARWIGDVKSD